MRRLSFALLFLAIGAICSLPRFGQRENERLPTTSDSDFYIDMAHVFAGQAARFNPEYVKIGPHHYNRPLLSFLAGHLAKALPGNNLRAAFSLVDLVSIVLAALLLMEMVTVFKPDTRLAWLPAVLLLSGFPQLNWGYHILSDTVGLATGFLTACYAAWLVRRTDAPAVWPWEKLLPHLALLFVFASLAFLARETAWLAVITTGWLAFVRRKRPGFVKLQLVGILLAVLLGKLPHTWYASHFQVTGVPFQQTFASLLNWRYLLDFAVKSAVCFNLSWLAAAAALRLRPRVPDFIIGWTIASLLYIAAGYVANNVMLIGYPLRLFYALFPLVFFLIGDLLEKRISPPKLTIAAIGFCVFQAAINFAGVMLDPAQGKITALDAWQKLRGIFLQ